MNIQKSHHHEKKNSTSFTRATIATISAIALTSSFALPYTSLIPRANAEETPSDVVASIDNETMLKVPEVKTSSNQTDAADAPEISNNEVIVVYKEEAKAMSDEILVADKTPLKNYKGMLPIELDNYRTSLEELGAQDTTTTIESTEEDSLFQGDVSVVEFTSDEEATMAADQLSQSPEIAYAVPNYLVDVEELPNDPGIVGWEWANGTFHKQDYLEVCHVTDAWEKAKCEGKNVTIAIIDEHCNSLHPDLAANVNPLSYHFGPNMPLNDYCAKYLQPGQHDWEVADAQGGHGTMVAAVANAVTNNKFATAGAAYNADLLLLPVAPVSDENSAMPADRIAEACNYLYTNIVNGKIKNHVILNMSLGSAYDPGDAQGAVQRDFYDGLLGKLASVGVLVVASAGNDNYGPEKVHYPSDSKYAISCEATNIDKTKAYFSNWGHSDVSCPGVDLLTDDLDPKYVCLFSGTSASSPLLAGSAALLYAADPFATTADVKKALIEGADNISVIDNKCAPFLNIDKSIDVLLSRDRSTGTTAKLSAPVEVEYGKNIDYKVEISNNVNYANAGGAVLAISNIPASGVTVQSIVAGNVKDVPASEITPEAGKVTFNRHMAAGEKIIIKYSCPTGVNDADQIINVTGTFGSIQLKAGTKIGADPSKANQNQNQNQNQNTNVNANETVNSNNNTGANVNDNSNSNTNENNNTNVNQNSGMNQNENSNANSNSGNNNNYEYYSNQIGNVRITPRKNANQNKAENDAKNENETTNENEGDAQNRGNGKTYLNQIAGTWTPKNANEQFAQQNGQQPSSENAEEGSVPVDENGNPVADENAEEITHEYEEAGDALPSLEERYEGETLLQTADSAIKIVCVAAVAAIALAGGVFIYTRRRKRNQ